RRKEEGRVRSGPEERGDEMTKLIATVAVACAGTALLLAQAGTAARSPAASTPKPLAPAAAAAQAGSARGSRPAPAPQRASAPKAVPAGDAKTYRAFVNQYCVGCHNTRNAQPASHPVDLEKAGLDDVVADAATWERVLRKLSVRAMPPQGMPH